MNDMVPADWNMEDDSSSRSFSRMLSPTNHRSPELSELLWRNGHVVKQSQTDRKPVSIENESKQDQKNEEGIKWSLFQEDESGSWLQYVLDDSIEKDFSSYFFCDASIADDTAEDKLAEDATTGERNMKFGAFGDKQSALPVQENTISEQPSLVFKANTMLPPEPCVIDSIPKNHNSGNSGWGVNFSQSGRPLKSGLELPHPQSGVKGSGYVDRINAVEPSSMVSIEMSVSGSNQVQNQVDPRQNMSDNATASLPRGAKDDTLISVSHERARIDPCDTSVTSSSGGSGCSFGRMRVQSASNQSRKRKGRDVADLECHSEETEYESVEAEKEVQRSTSARRSRAAEVHNLSERRRRDRINEKMRALQELIPHCNKSDKASMLDEAIEYLKALQQQVQIMWMGSGSGMVPMMFPGVQQYMSRFSMGIPHVTMPSIPHAIQLPGVSPLLNQSIPSGLANQVNFPNQMQNVRVPDQYAHGIAPQAMNTSTYRSQRVQLNQTAAPANPRNRRNGCSH